MSRTRLLLADDSVSVQRIIELTFVDEDVDVVAVDGGRAAIEDIRRQPPDIVLADTRMPEGDGYEVADFVRRNPDLAQIPVVLLTGAFDPVDAVRAREVRSSAVLVKPFEARQVIGTVRELLGARGGASAATGSAPPAAPPAPSAGSASTAAPAPSAGSAPPPASPPPAPAAGAFQATAGPAAPIEQWPHAEGGSPPVPVPPPAEAATEEDPAAAPAPVVLAEGSVLADAFAALLAAEQGSPPDSAATPAAGGSPPRYTLPDEVVTDLVERVAGRLTDDYLRERAAAVVSEVAEQVVRDEIARARGGA